MTDPCKNNAFAGHNGVSVVASLPTNQSRDVTANIPIGKLADFGKFLPLKRPIPVIKCTEQLFLIISLLAYILCNLKKKKILRSPTLLKGVGKGGWAAGSFRTGKIGHGRGFFSRPTYGRLGTNISCYESTPYGLTCCPLYDWSVTQHNTTQKNIVLTK